MYMMDCILPFVESVLKSLQVAGSESLPPPPHRYWTLSAPPSYSLSTPGQKPLYQQLHLSLAVAKSPSQSLTILSLSYFIFILFYTYPIDQFNHFITILHSKDKYCHSAVLCSQSCRETLVQTLDNTFFDNTSLKMPLWQYLYLNNTYFTIPLWQYLFNDASLKIPIWKCLFDNTSLKMMLLLYWQYKHN